VPTHGACLTRWESYSRINAKLGNALTVALTTHVVSATDFNCCIRLTGTPMPCYSPGTLRRAATPAEARVLRRSMAHVRGVRESSQC